MGEGPADLRDDDRQGLYAAAHRAAPGRGLYPPCLEPIDKGHNLTQKSFFRFARVAPADRIWTREGQITLGAHEHAIVRLRAPNTRSGGTYQFSSTTLGDAGMDYKGIFVIR